MKIGLVTSEESFLNNYGAVLQGYALYKTLENMGHEVEIIRYGGTSPRARTIRFKIKRNIFKIYKKFFKKDCGNIFNQYKNELKEITKRMQNFQDETLKFYNKKRWMWPDINKKSIDLDAFVCGSDQIWNPYYKAGYNDPGYFLDFVPDGKKRIAYSPSFGCDDIPPAAQSDIKYYLSKFSFVSVREPEGAAIIKKYTQMNVPVLADPTFLLTSDQWEKMAKLPDETPDKYILCYRFMKNDKMTECMNYLSELLEIPVITIPLSDIALRDSYKKEFRVGPGEFIGLISNATLVCTDSFHATAFSLITNTPFYTFLDLDAMGKGTNMNSRIRNIIKLAELENRVLYSKGDVDIENLTTVDFSRFNENIKNFRNSSLEALAKALEESV